MPPKAAKPAPRTAKKKDTYNFTLVKNYPKYKSFDIMKQPETDFVSAFMKTLSQLFKGD
jgi:hypothetical protein